MHNNVKVAKVLLKNQKREDRRGDQFLFEWLDPLDGACYLREKPFIFDKQGSEQLRTKYSISFSKPYLDSEEKEVVCNENNSSNSTYCNFGEFMQCNL